MKKLNSNQVERIRKPGLHRIERSFFIKVRSGGSRQYVQRLIIGGKPRDIGLGGADVVTLDEARAKALHNRTLLAQGINPLAEKSEIAKAVAVSICPSFGDLETVAFQNKSTGWKAGSKTPQTWRQTMADYVLPVIGSKPVDQITAQDCLTILHPLFVEKRETGVKTRTYMNAVFSLAISRGLIQVSPVGKQIDVELPAKAKGEKNHHESLPWAEVPAFVDSLQTARATLPVRMALEFVILSGCRVSEVLGMTWDELDGDTWDIPASRMKSERPHRVPVTGRMAEILERMGSHGTSQLVFPGRKGKALDARGIRRLAGELADCTVHGFRGSFRMWAADRGYSSDVAEAALAHTVGGVEATYQRSDLLDRRRNLMEAWADHVMSAPRGKVIKLRA